MVRANGAKVVQFRGDVLADLDGRGHRAEPNPVKSSMANWARASCRNIAYLTRWRALSKFSPLRPERLEFASR